MQTGCFSNTGQNPLCAAIPLIAKKVQNGYGPD